MRLGEQCRERDGVTKLEQGLAVELDRSMPIMASDCPERPPSRCASTLTETRLCG